jgi:hypothetical protein
MFLLSETPWPPRYLTKISEQREFSDQREKVGSPCNRIKKPKLCGGREEV